MKTAIIYVSYHHGNTKKILDAIVKENNDIVLLNGYKDKIDDLNQYDRIGFASGIAFSKLYPKLISIIEDKLPNDKDIFFIYTSGSNTKKGIDSLKELIKERNANVLGVFNCKGYDTYGIFKLIGGISKKHPNEKDINNALEFYAKL